MARTKGSKNVTALEKIRANRDKLEKMLLDRAMAGDPVAIGECLKLLRDEESNRPSSRRKKLSTPGDDPLESKAITPIEPIIQQ